MPWCDHCDVFVAVDELVNRRHGSCGTATDLSDIGSIKRTTPGSVKSEYRQLAPPWHFWLLVGALSAYLMWRLIVFLISWMG